MKIRLSYAVAVLVPAFLVAAIVGVAQEKKEIKKTPAKNTSPASGSEMFISYCAPCHGKDGKGDGPAASALKVPPTNLTLLAKNNGGKYPADHVTNVLRSGTSAAHGSSEMPVWGPIFSRVSSQEDAIVQMRISNLNRYIESIQAK